AMQSVAYIKVKLLTYRNSRGLLSNGQCCESNCQSMCSHKFIICLDPIGSNWVDSCLYGYGTTGVIENKNYITFEDSVKAKDRKFSFGMKSWPGGVFLKINVTNQGHNGAKQQVDYFGKNFYLGPDETKQVILGTMTVLTLEIQVTCQDNFYSHNCSVFCEPQDSDSKGHYICDKRDGSKICRTDWKGPNCSVNVDDCANVRCRNGGTCQDRKRDFFCNCQSGFTGRLCEADINECLNQSLCQNGKCVNNYGSFICTCYKGFTGRRCESNINDCASSPCQNAGYCIDLVSAYTCRCSTGFTGRHCEQDLNECSFRNTCKNGGTCLNLIGSYGCNCPSSFQGYDCSQDVDECQQTSRCKNGGWCSNSVGSYSCHCPKGFNGQDCEKDIDECLLMDKLCENNATCLNTIGSFSCSCSGGYYGLLCSIDINECVRNPCRNGAMCENMPGHYKCLCPQGRTGELCQFDIDECTPGICLNGGNCFNVPGSYYCECSGYWEGKNCEMNVDECKSRSKLCENNGTCQDVVEGYRCNCLEGFFGTLCEQDRDECALGLCFNNVSCANTFGSFHCSCAPGWTGSRCDEDMNECLEPVCNNEGVCVNSNGSYHCRCPANWMGQRCEMDIDECSMYQNLCQNGGTCVNLQGSYHCKCPPEWAGPMCDVDKVECAKNKDACEPIGNSFSNVSISSKREITCRNFQTGNWCQCSAGWTSFNCNQDFNECIEGLAKNSADGDAALISLREMIDKADLSPSESSQGNIDSYHSRRFVSKTMPEVKPFSPTCLEGASCVNVRGNYSCACPVNFTGKMCEILVCNVTSESCSHHSNCPSHDKTNSCVCFTVIKNEYSQWNLTCHSKPCLNKGACEECRPSKNMIACNCIIDWSTTLCRTCVAKFCKRMCAKVRGCLFEYNNTIGQASNASLETNSSVDGVVTLGSSHKNSSGSLKESATELCSNEYCFSDNVCFHSVDDTTPRRCRCPIGVSDGRCVSFSSVDQVTASTLSDVICPAVICHNNGSCKRDGGAWSCLCSNNWSGKYCEADRSPCRFETCHTHGNCSTDTNMTASVCLCDPGWTGRFCDSRLDRCARRPCQNKGLCSVSEDGYSCKCQGMWSGAECTLIELSIPFYLHCNVSQAGVWKVNKGLEALLKATRLYDKKRLDVSHRLQRGKALDGTSVTAIYPVVKNDGELLNQQELVYALNKVTSKFQHHMYCPLYLDAVDNSDFVEILTAEKQNWIPGLLTVCGFLLLGIFGLSIVKCRRMYTSHRDKCRLQKSRVTRSFRNQLYLETSRGHLQEMVENQINIISTGTVPHYATVDEMRESQTETNSMTKVDAERNSEVGPPELNAFNVPSGRPSGLESDTAKQESVFYMMHPKNMSLATSKQRKPADEQSSMLAGKQDPLPALPHCTYYNDGLYSSPVCNLGKTKTSRVRAQATSQPCDGAQGPLNPEELYVDVVRRRKLGHPRKRTRSLDDKSLYKKHNPRGRKRFSDVDRKYKHLPYIDDPPFHETLLLPQIPGTLLHPQTPGTLLHPQTSGTLLHPQTPGTLLHPQTPGTLLHPQTSGTLLHPQTPGTLLHPQTPGTLLHPHTPGSLLHPQTPGTLLHPQTIDTLLQPINVPST
ncbi:fibropellin-1, partial [Biomphalaria pfeifferi]